jgi:hypothetical protein
VCPYHAKKAITDDFDRIFDYKYKIALVAPSLYVQFKSKPDINAVLTGILKLGFDEVFEVARAAELISETTKDFIKNEKYPKPLISSACPAVVRLIRLRFPNLLPNVVPILAPIELGAMLVKEKAIADKGYNPNDIGAFFITPCAAKVTCSYSPLGIESSLVDGCISMKDLYLKLLPIVNKTVNPQKLATAGIEGIAWANNGGESSALKNERHIAVDGIWNVIKVLEEVEKEKLDSIDFVEASACVGGCIGGPLTVENPFVAKTRMSTILDNTTLSPSTFSWDEYINNAARWKVPLEYESVMKLDDDLQQAMVKLEKMEEIFEGLPQLDCGSCGAPSCKALAEDIVRGFAVETDCVFKLRERVKKLATEMAELEGKRYGQGNK